MKVTGLNGVTIDEAWKEKIYSYGGIALLGFPNLFMQGEAAPAVADDQRERRWAPLSQRQREAMEREYRSDLNCVTACPGRRLGDLHAAGYLPPVTPCEARNATNTLRQKVVRFEQPNRFRGPLPSLRHFPGISDGEGLRQRVVECRLLSR
jgi:hypothetical protein